MDSEKLQYESLEKINDFTLYRVLPKNIEKKQTSFHPLKDSRKGSQGKRTLAFIRRKSIT